MDQLRRLLAGRARRPPVARERWAGACSASTSDTGPRACDTATSAAACRIAQRLGRGRLRLARARAPPSRRRPCAFWRHVRRLLKPAASAASSCRTCTRSSRGTSPTVTSRRRRQTGQQQRSADGHADAARGPRRAAAIGCSAAYAGPRICTSTSGCTTRKGCRRVFEEAGFARPAARQYLDSAIPREPLEQVERADRLCDGAGVCVEAVDVAMRRVLMVSPHFPPDSSAASHRVRLLAPHLEEAGWSPTVVTLEPSAYEGRLDPDLEALVPASLRVVRAPAWPARRDAARRPRRSRPARVHRPAPHLPRAARARAVRRAVHHRVSRVSRRCSAPG